MGILEFLGIRKWKPNLEREPPPKTDWPGKVVSLNVRGFDGFIDKYPLSVVDFWAPWCGPCKVIAPRIRQLSKKYRGRAAFGKVDITDNRKLAGRYHVMGIPNLIFFSYGKKVTNITGVRSERDIRKTIDGILERFDREDG